MSPDRLHDIGRLEVRENHAQRKRFLWEKKAFIENFVSQLTGELLMDDHVRQLLAGTEDG